MQSALRQAWESSAAGSLGVGAAATHDDGVLIAVGRNRLLETDPGVDVIADLGWDDLSGCVAEVAALAADDGSVPDR